MSTKHSRFLIQNARTANIVFSTHVPVYIYKGAIFLYHRKLSSLKEDSSWENSRSHLTDSFSHMTTVFRNGWGILRDASLLSREQHKGVSWVSSPMFLSLTKIMLIHTVLPRGVSTGMSSKTKHEEVTADTFRTVIIRTENEMALSWDMTWHDPTLGQSNLIPGGKGVALLPSQIL